MSKSPRKQYALLTFPDVDNEKRYSIFAGKTSLSAFDKAMKWVVSLSLSSRKEHEEKHGPVSDDEWFKIMEEVGFTITLVDSVWGTCLLWQNRIREVSRLAKYCGNEALLR